MTENEYRTFLATRRANLRAMYARYREYGLKMHRKGLVNWSAEDQAYRVEPYYYRGQYKQRTAITALLDLQRNIKQQAMLLLELEHAVDQERKQNEKRE